MATFELERWHNAFKGQECLIVGNGPSLNKVPPQQFNMLSFATNMIAKWYEGMSWRHDFYVAVSDGVFITEYYPYFKKGVEDAKYHVFASWGNRELIKGISNATAIEASIRPAEFSENPEVWVSRAYMSHLVTFQLAWYMGFETMHLTGFDLNFKPLGEGEDTNHAVKDYWGDRHRKREKNGLNYDMMNEGHLKAHQIVAEAAEKHGFLVVDHTPDGPLGDVYGKHTV